MFASYYDKICVITGASSGLGAEFAKSLARRGAKVVLFARRGERLQRLVETLYNPELHLVVVGDVTKAKDRARLIEQTIQKYGRIDVLINNAGMSDGDAGFMALSPEKVEQILNVNFVGAVLLTHAALPHMQNGLIINVSSPMGIVNLPGYALYNSTKAGLSAFSQTLSRELNHVHVLDARPAFTFSEMVSEEFGKKLPRFLVPREAEGVIEEILRAALAGKRDVMTGQKIIHLGLFTNRNFPRLFDLGIKLLFKRLYKW